MYALYILFYRILIQLDNRRYPLKKCFRKAAIIQELRTVNAFSRIKLGFITGGLALGNQICMLEYIKLGWSIAGTSREMGGIGYWNFWEFPGWRMRVSQYGRKSYVGLVGLVTQLREPLSVNKNVMSVDLLAQPCSICFWFLIYHRLIHTWSLRIWRISTLLIGERSLCKLMHGSKNVDWTDWSTRSSRSKLGLKRISAWKNSTPHVYRQWQV